MLFATNLLVTFIVGTNAISFLTNEWTESVKLFFQQTQQKINEKSNQFMNGLLNFFFLKLTQKRKKKLKN